MDKPLNIEGTNDQVHKVFPQDHGSVNRSHLYNFIKIYRRVWEDVPLNAAGAIAVHIRHLREKLEINPSEPRYIKVVWGKGYKMEGGIS